jgi:D-alanyl-D-alanine carboxypeptidase
MVTLRVLLAALVAASVLAPPARARTTDADVQRGLERLVASPGGPPGAIATLNRGGRRVVLRAGRANTARPGAPKPTDHMRIASVAKAFSGAIALHLVAVGKLGLDDTIGERRPDLPRAWARVTVRQLLNHTSGVPDYTRSQGFADQVRTAPRAFVSPKKVISWVAADPLVFAPGSRYTYSNTDNIVIGLIAEAVTGRSYGRLLHDIVFDRAGLLETSFPTSPPLPHPFIHGYTVAGSRAVDVSEFLSPSGAWASGAIVSTPSELNAFVRNYLGGTFFGAAQKREQFRFVRGGQSSPPGPGLNSAGLALFRYHSRCGTVYGHTGNFPGYVQWAAATRDGSRSVTTSLNIPAPEGTLLTRLRNVQARAVCALLGR